MPEYTSLFHHDRLFCYLALFIFTLMLFSFNGFSTDDSFISYRYAQHLSEGYGLVFNREGTPVEGFSNFLWTLLLAVAAKLKFDLPVAGKSLSIIFGYLSLVIVGIWSRHQSTLNESISVSFPMLVLACHPSFAIWSVSGMETTFFTFLLLLACLTIAIEERNQTASLLSGLIFGCVSLTRPEGIFFSLLIIIGAHFESEDRSKRHTAFFTRLIILMLISITFFIWRKSYFGEWLPNTYYAKIDSFETLLPFGTTYFLEFVKVGGAWLLALSLLTVFVKPAVKGRYTLLLFSAAYVAFTLSVGGDWMPASRLFIPLIPVLCILSNLVVARMSISVRTMALTIIWISLLYVSGSGLFFLKEHIRGSTLDTMVLGNPKPVDVLKELGLYLKANSDPYDVIAVVPAGKVPYYSELRAIDMRGLCDSHIARVPVEEKNKQIVGHFKRDAKYVLDQKPMFVVTSGSVSKIPARLQSLPPPSNKVLDNWEILNEQEFQKCYKEMRIPIENSDKEMMFYQRNCNE